MMIEKNALFDQLSLIGAWEDHPPRLQLDLISFYPELLSSLAHAMWKNILSFLPFHFLYPLTPTSIPLATVLSLTLEKNFPLILPSSEKKLIQPGQTALLLTHEFDSVLEQKISELKEQGIFPLYLCTVLESSIPKALEIPSYFLWSLEEIQNSYSKIPSFDIS
jgi:hypothetical protein